MGVIGEPQEGSGGDGGKRGEDDSSAAEQPQEQRKTKISQEQQQQRQVATVEGEGMMIPEQLQQPERLRKHAAAAEQQ